VIYGLDMVSAPTEAQAATMFELGWRFLGCYVGGPRAAAGHHGWPNAAVGVLANVGFSFLPIYVGRNHPWDDFSAFTFQQGVLDGDEANSLTGACGFDSDTPLCLDLEYGTYQSDPQGARQYLRGWVQQVNAAGHKACLYSDLETLGRLGTPDLVDLLWGAAWVREAFTLQPPLGRFDPTTPPPWNAWQYAGGTIAGVSVDCNSATDDFPFAQYQPAAVADAVVA
jgi:Domain of unknown function (DUF1906)